MEEFLAEYQRAQGSTAGPTMAPRTPLPRATEHKKEDAWRERLTISLL